jgi:hypothetical protein
VKNLPRLPKLVPQRIKRWKIFTKLFPQNKSSSSLFSTGPTGFVKVQNSFFLSFIPEAYANCSLNVEVMSSVAVLKPQFPLSFAAVVGVL